MSNDIVGKLYKDVIDSVVQSSQGDFEDNGIELSVLEELRHLWQQKLSSFGVARFPWDAVPVATGGMYDGLTGAALMPQAGGAVGTVGSGASTVGMGGPGVGARPYSGAVKREESNGDNATMRAAQNIQQFGQENKESVPSVDRSVEALMRSRAGGAGGGILTPDMFNNSSASKGETASRGPSSNNSSTNNISTPGGLVLPGRGNGLNQTDGPGDDDNEDDDDAGNDSEQIGSDLDDSEDDLASGAEDEEEEGGMIMLCLYDKVQRVKNKWKYVLKDGVANINGKDYVFSRGTGESEW